MCLVILALGQHARYPLILAANRDEFHARPSAGLHAWPDRPGILGGRDLEKGGSWLAAARRGALAVVTNVRDPARRVTGGPSRGDLVSDFLGDDAALALRYVPDRCAPGLGYDGFNLIAVDRSGAWYGSNRGAVRQIPQLTAQLQVPSLWIAGSRDQVMEPRYVRHLAGYSPRHQLAILSGVGHLPMVETPRALAALIDTWLEDDLALPAQPSGLQRVASPFSCSSASWA